jgi:hypothetical protein
MKATTEQQLESLQNAITNLELEVTLVPFYFNDGRRKSKFILVSVEGGVSISPALYYDDMNHFIFGMHGGVLLQKELEFRQHKTK